MEGIADWSFRPRKVAAKVERCAHFDARGMAFVFGRGDHFSSRRTFNMDIWMTRDGRLLMRFWSRSMDIDGRSFEISGVNTAGIPANLPGTVWDEKWIPKAVREAYDKWIQEEI